MTKDPLISVVMPVYGSEAYVSRAITSVREQTYENWELIVVDDCTPDASATIARAAAEQDARIRVVSHTENKGLAEARNTGLAEARGEWVWMPDSDDYVDTNLLERAVVALTSSDANLDLVMFGICEEYYDAQGTHLYNHELALEDALYPTPESWHGLVIDWENSTHLGYAWNKLFSLAKIRELDLRFESIRLIEDILFALSYLESAEAIATISGTPYYYAKRRGTSLTGANAFSAREYWGLLEQRVRKLLDALDGWGVLNDEALAKLGGLYCRFIVSALERTHFAGETWTHEERVAWLAEMRDGELYQKLVPYAASSGSRAVDAAIKAVQSNLNVRILSLALITYVAHARAYSLFTRLRSGR